MLILWHDTYFVSRQQALLAAISEKDANIALLELSASNKKKTQDEVLGLKRDRDKLMLQLKQHVSRDTRAQNTKHTMRLHDETEELAKQR